LKTYFNTLIKNTTLNVNIIRTGLHFTKYHGYGNETSFSKKLDEINFYRLEEELLKITPMLYFNLFNKAMSGIGISYEYSNINLTNNSLLLETKRDNYGLGKLKLVGTHLLFNIDTRDNITNPYKGIFLNIKGSLYPKLLDVKETFYKLEFDARTYFKTKIITDNIFAFRIGGGKLWNDYPFSKSIVLGGENNLRGFSRERFSGDASLFAQAEIRTYLVPIKYGLPGKFGIHFFGETGRVFTENDNSKKWHLSYGGGVWLSLIDRMVSLSFDMAVSEEFNNFYLRFSMPF
jgi:outer membrane protein assembly factor BamA